MLNTPVGKEAEKGKKDESIRMNYETWTSDNGNGTFTNPLFYDDFSGAKLKPVWQWNNVPVDAKWSLTKRRGYLLNYPYAWIGVSKNKEGMEVRQYDQRTGKIQGKKIDVSTIWLRADGGFITVVGLGSMGEVRIVKEIQGEASTFQWQDMLRGDLMLMSIKTHRYLFVDPNARSLSSADSPGTRPDRKDGSCFMWKIEGY